MCWRMGATGPTLLGFFFVSFVCFVCFVVRAFVLHVARCSEVAIADFAGGKGLAVQAHLDHSVSGDFADVA